jgi:hypothetical protein
VGSHDRSIRAAATALLVAAAVGSAGMGGVSPARAAEPGTVRLAGTLVSTEDGADAPLADVELVITEELEPDGGLAAFPVTTAEDGTFAADVFAWGTAEDPAIVTIGAVRAELDEVDPSCSRRWAVGIEPGMIQLPGSAPDGLVVRQTLTLLGEVCGTTAPPPANGPGSRATVTPPPTDTPAAPLATRPDRLGPALTIGFVIGLLAVAALLRLRAGARRRD